MTHLIILISYSQSWLMFSYYYLKLLLTKAFFMWQKRSSILTAGLSKAKWLLAICDLKDKRPKWVSWNRPNAVGWKRSTCTVWLPQSNLETSRRETHYTSIQTKITNNTWRKHLLKYCLYERRRNVSPRKKITAMSLFNKNDHKWTIMIIISTHM